MPLCDSSTTASGFSSSRICLNQRDHVVLAQAERPVREELLRVGIRGAREGLADDGDARAVDLLDHIRLEGMTGVFVEQAATVIFLDQRRVLITEQRIRLDAHVLTDEITLEQCHVGQHLVLLVGELPVTDHDVETEDVGRLDHVDAAGPQRGARALPQVAAVQGQGVVPSAGLLTQPVQQGLHVRETAGAAVFHRRRVEIQIGVGIRLGRRRLQPHRIEQFAADQMRRPAEGIAYTQVDVGLAEIDRLQLTVHVGDVQQAHIALHRQVVETLWHLGVR